ncbi:family 16 glycosylhydrolase [Spirochaetia bacterium 38H-sp]|uniref:Family 16 glycosylhydrolase n=1 Tax=Rarispira pelagica TaxID=3141764 RepID=A0ABU9UCR0_9SPIR
MKGLRNALFAGRLLVLAVLLAVGCQNPASSSDSSEATPTPTPTPTSTVISGNGDFSEPLSTAEPDADGNLDTGGSWALYVNSGGAATADVTSNQLAVTVTNAGTAQWSVQLLQAPITVEENGIYHVSFDAAASADGMQVILKVGGTAGVSWQAYHQETFTLSTTMTTYTADFTMTGSTDNQARFEFWFQNTGSYTLDNVSLTRTGTYSSNEGTLTETDEDAVENWQLVWSDEFDGTSLDTTYWSYEIGNGQAQGIPGWGNNELEYYQQNNVSVSGGYLTIEARNETVTDSYGSYNYTSGKIVTKDKFDFTYGRVEIRAKLPKGQGIWPALWMLGADIDTNAWPNCGEIDIMELIGSQPEVIHGTIHGPISGGSGVGSGYTLTSGDFSDDFHVFAMEWDDDEVEFYVDDILFHVVNKNEILSDWVFDHAFYFIFNVAVGGSWPGDPDATTVFPQQMQVDYIRVYEDINPDTISGQEVWDCDYEKTWTPPAEPAPTVTQVTATDDTEYYLLNPDSNLTDATIGWNNTSYDGDITPDVWGSGSSYDPNATYSGEDCFDITGGYGWGGLFSVLAFMGDLYGGTNPADFPVDVSTYTNIVVRIALKSTPNDIRIKLAGSEKEISVASYFDLNDTTNWQEATIPLSVFGTQAELAGTTQVAVFMPGGNGYYLSKLGFIYQ